GHSADDVIVIAAALEQGSSHPLAAAILRKAEDARIRIPAASDHESIPGKGARGTVNGSAVILGSLAFLAENGVDVRDGTATRRDQANTVVGIASGGECIGTIAIADRLRESTPSAIKRLRAHGIDVVMITGDNEATAQAIARAAGIASYRAGVLPADKAATVRGVKAEGRAAGMVAGGGDDA